jgi:hypothetical protein
MARYLVNNRDNFTFTCYITLLERLYQNVIGGTRVYSTLGGEEKLT